jgi:hypothetical protein
LPENFPNLFFKKPVDKQSPPATFQFIGRTNASDKNQKQTTKTMTTQKQIRARFWRDHKGIAGISRKQITDYSGDGKMHNTDTRTAFVDWIDALAKSGEISEQLADKATL